MATDNLPTGIQSTGEGTAAGIPAVSVLMPVRNEAGTVTAALDSLVHQTYPHDHLEILVADGRSEDSTRDTIRAWSARHPDIRIRILDNPHRLQAPGLNLALGEATGDLVFIMSSAHGAIAPDYVEGLVSALGTDTSIWVVGGRSQAVGRTRWGRAVAAAIQSPAGLGAPAWRTGHASADVDHVGYGVYRREAFERVGGFDEGLVINEDYDLTYRIRAAGGRVRLEPVFEATYITRDTPRLLARQYWIYGLFKARMAAQNPASIKIRHVVPALFTGTMAALAVTSLRSRTARCLLATISTAYAGVVATAAIRACRDEPDLAPDTAAAMVVMHTVYGAGEIVGLCRFSVERLAEEGSS